jgi:hypothetical protein
MKAGVAKRVRQFQSTGSDMFDQGYNAGWEAAKKYYTQGDQMPVPEGIITTTEILQAVVPPEPEVEDTEEEAEDAK